MGIPRLTSDVAPYMEAAILGKSLPGYSAIEVTKLVIDGPSLVYHVFNALSRASDGRDTSLTGGLPSYHAINACLEQFLRDVTASGAHIQSIIFDGALPESKRVIRLERLERARRNLEQYRKLQPLAATTTEADTPTISSHTSRGDAQVLRNALWNCSSTPSVKVQLLPSPPFMVASAIEWLHLSQWSSVVYTVPGEADSYCARDAAASGAAILSNDSDLLLYQLGVHGLVLMLRTLEIVQRAHGTDQDRIKAQCVRPVQLTRKLNVPGMLEFGFHRLKDHSASTAVIAQRARTQIPPHDDVTWMKFQREYEVDDLPYSMTPDCLGHSLKRLDPRTAELVCSLIRSQALHMYLPAVIEDPTRDSSWSYGIELRRLAYSMLLCGSKSNTSLGESSFVMEYARKGNCITENKVGGLSSTFPLEETETVIRKIGYYLAYVSSTGISKVRHGITTHSACGHGGSDSTLVLAFFLFAADVVIRKRKAKSKPYESCLFNIFPAKRLSTVSASVWTWEDVHFFANIESVLYSLRVVNQVAIYVGLHTTLSLDDGARGVLHSLIAKLASMPSIADLFLDANHLRSSLTNMSRGIVTEALKSLLHQVDPTNNAVSGTTKAEYVNRGTQVSNGVSVELAAETWQETHGRKWSRRSIGGDKNHNVINPTKSTNAIRKAAAACRTVSRKSTNTFAMLDMDETQPEIGD